MTSDPRIVIGRPRVALNDGMSRRVRETRGSDGEGGTLVPSAHLSDGAGEGTDVESCLRFLATLHVEALQRYDRRRLRIVRASIPQNLLSIAVGDRFIGSSAR